MKLIIAFILSLILSTAALAQNINWNQVDLALSTKAEYQETPFGLYATLKRIESGPTNYANYLSGIGGFNENGQFWSSRYEIVSEAWKKVDGNWHIDQWLFTVNLNQDISFKLHRKMIQTPDATVLELENIPEDEEVYSQKLNSILSDWLKVI